MNPEIDIVEAINEMIGHVLTVLIPVHKYQEIAEASHAVDAGTATDEQLELITRITHTAFDEHDGCMVATVREMAERGAPHYFINHAIRTYVRLCDKREAGQQ